jgi:protein-L-isoaspartate(D-aspartate) O-methyltransferase
MRFKPSAANLAKLIRHPAALWIGNFVYETLRPPKVSADTTTGSRTRLGVFDEQRRDMVDRQLRGGGIRSARVLEAMHAIPRHEFVPPDYQADAYTDQPLPIGIGQTISQPLMVAAMSEALELVGADRVLEIGTGSGYQTAVLSRLAGEVFTIEYYEELAAAARRRLERLGCRNVQVRHGDGGPGWPEAAPFQAIVVTAAAPAPPPPLLEQLAEAGRLVAPVGGDPYQELLLLHKHGSQFERRSLYWCRFVPLLGIYGWESPIRG